MVLLDILFALSVIGFFASPVILIVGLISPKTVNKHLHKEFSRKRIAVIFTSLTIVFFVLDLVIAPLLSSSGKNESVPTKSNPIQLTPSPQPQHSQAELDYTNGSKDLINQYLAQDDILQNEIKSNPNTTKLINDLGTMIGNWVNASGSHVVYQPPDSFKSYDTMLSLATSDVTRALQNIACYTSQNDSDSVNKEKSKYDQVLGYIKNDPMTPGSNYDDQIETLRDMFGGYLFGKYLDLDHCYLEPKSSETENAFNLYVTNNNNFTWTECSATIEDTDSQGNSDNYYSDNFDLQPGHTERIGWGDFLKADGTRYNYFAKEPQEIELDCTVNHLDYRGWL